MVAGSVELAHSHASQTELRNHQIRACGCSSAPPVDLLISESEMSLRTLLFLQFTLAVCPGSSLRTKSLDRAPLGIYGLVSGLGLR